MKPNQPSPERLTGLYKLARFSDVDGAPRNREASELVRYLESCGKEQAQSAPAEVALGEAVEVVAYLCDYERQDGTVETVAIQGRHTVKLCPPDFGEPVDLMTVAQHNRIMAAACKPDVQVPVTGSLDEIDAPVWPFINEEARKVGAEKGRIETYSYGLANGGVVVLWDGPRVHAMAVTIRDDLNRTRCVRITAAAKPDAELVELIEFVRAKIRSAGRCHTNAVEYLLAEALEAIDAKLASVKPKGEPCAE